MNRWPTTSLKGYIMEVSIRKGNIPTDVLSITNTGGFVRSLEVFDKQVFSQDTSNYKLVRFDNLAYNPSRINVGSVARCHFPEGGAVSPMYVVVQCRKSLLPQFLLYFLKSDIGKQHINHRCVGAVRFQLRFSDLEQIELPLPPISEQKRIIQILAEAENLKFLRTQVDQKTNDLISSLFYEMFGDVAKNSKQFPTVLLSDCIQLIGGHAFRSEDFCEQGIPVIRIGNANKGSFDLTDIVFLPTSFSQTHARFIIKPNDIVMTLTGTVGKDDYGNVCFVSNRYDCWLLNQRVAKIEFTTDKLTKEYLFYAFRQPSIKMRLIQNNKGSRQANLSNKDILNLILPAPEARLQDVFAARVADIRSMQAEQDESRRKLDQLFQSLLHRAFQGEL